MLIVNATHYEGAKHRNCPMQLVYKCLTSEDVKENPEVNHEVLSHLIAWLPSINMIQIYSSMDNSWMDITFSNGQSIERIYNIGIEYELKALAD